MSDEKCIPIAGYPVSKTTSPVLARYLRQTVKKEKKVSLFFANTNFIVQCRYLLGTMKGDSVTIVNDGIGMDIAAFLFRRDRFQENLNGTDFIPYFFSGLARPLRVFMLGGKPEVLAKAAHHVRVTLGQTVVGTCDGYTGIEHDHAELVTAINLSQAEVVLVALGNPIQEEWILLSRQMLHANVVIGVGALFDFWSGDKTRAPDFLQRTRLEWLYRLCLEPQRLLRRYTIDIMRFLLLCRKHRADVSNRHTRPAGNLKV
ncbi:WecB/TagA/CpsF family glycosyltransferase [Glaciimonas immobilis]|uniref:Beta-1,4-glucosyltransferase n=1 Tax=Glaciimonas immobilis TaxID=728004 RepID=A0A840RWN7_9BURK|nr:WecB/TagA/CpsF family glycosyltransferase [Glaciimonas immobilis]KAF3998375.1 WecB/TagA/CpsF family glycosyltransferase [Glaciimonas immobilis]MBB5202003.1 beta-1,4-glucosyltransferase [Glaciimonas immobilis]